MSSISSKTKKPLSEKDHKLINSADSGNLQVVCDLLRAGANVNAQRDDGATSLYVASQNGHLEVVRLLLKHNKVNVNLQCTDGATALYIASQNARLKVVEKLLQHNQVNLNLKRSNGTTALYMASQKGHVDVVGALLHHKKVEVNLQRSNGTSALHMASQKGHVEVVRALLKHNKVDVNLQLTNGISALYIASRNGDSGVISELLKHKKMDVNLQYTNGATALYMASKNGRLDVVEKLLQHKMVNVDLPMKNGRTALMVASANGHVDVDGALLKHSKVDVNLQCKDDGATALYMASQNGSLKVVDKLLQHNKVNVDLPMKNGQTALMVASVSGHVGVVEKLLENNKVDVNLRCPDDGATALYMASQNGRLDVVEKLLQHNKLNVNQSMNNGQTALMVASANGHAAVVEKLLENNKVDVRIKDNNGRTALDEAKQSDIRKILGDRERTLQAVTQNRALLDKVMKTSKDPPAIRMANPVELSYQYIKRYINNHKLGSGAFGDVFLAEDSALPEPKKFAVKMIKLIQRSDGASDKGLNSFQRELLVFKSCRHTNIIALYGYNFEGSAGEQFLVYEHAANGSLDKFLKDDEKRADLPADKRLSIMYGVAKAVHFLHTEVRGYKVFHRDIKSANICLTEDFTPRLSDCGLAKFVEKKHNPNPSVTIIQSGSTVGPATGTHMYRCPEYSWKKEYHIKGDYIPAYDVYSFGVVMAELILGRLNDGKLTNGKPADVLQTCVLNGEKPVVDGWKQLKNDADIHASWNADALELVCKTAMGCITSFSEERLSMETLLDLLKHASDLQDEETGVVPEDAIATLDRILRNISKRKSKSEGAGLGFCKKCDDAAGGNRHSAVVQCSDGHALCRKCIEEAILKPVARNGDRILPCLMRGCTSLPFKAKDLCGRIDPSVYSFFSLEHDVVEIRQNMLLLNEENAKRLKQCPALVVINKPSTVNGRSKRRTCFTNLLKQKYEVAFCCARLRKPCHEPFEISVDRKWIVNLAPCLRVAVHIGSALEPTKVTQGVMREYPLPAHTNEMKALIDVLQVKEKHGVVQTVEGVALEAIGKKANKEKNKNKWLDTMEYVEGENGGMMWVKKDDEGKQQDDVEDEKQDDLEEEKQDEDGLLGDPSGLDFASD